MEVGVRIEVWTVVGVIVGVGSGVGLRSVGVEVGAILRLVGLGFRSS